MSWEFPTRQIVEALHTEQLRRHGGAAGLRDETALEAALNRAANKALYEAPDAHNLAAAYAFALARNHPFIDGNKRTAIVTAALFLALNGYTLAADNGQLYVFTMALAAGEVDEQGAARFFREHSVKLPL